jgi:hypothetical protein
LFADKAIGWLALFLIALAQRRIDISAEPLPCAADACNEQILFLISLLEKEKKNR